MHLRTSEEIKDKRENFLPSFNFCFNISSLLMKLNKDKVGTILYQTVLKHHRDDKEDSEDL